MASDFLVATRKSPKKRSRSRCPLRGFPASLHRTSGSTDGPSMARRPSGCFLQPPCGQFLVRLVTRQRLTGIKTSRPLFLLFLMPHWVCHEHRKHLWQRSAHRDVCAFSTTIGISCWKTAQTNVRSAVGKHPWVAFFLGTFSWPGKKKYLAL